MELRANQGVGKMLKYVWKNDIHAEILDTREISTFQWQISETVVLSQSVVHCLPCNLEDLSSNPEATFLKPGIATQHV